MLFLIGEKSDGEFFNFHSRVKGRRIIYNVTWNKKCVRVNIWAINRVPNCRHVSFRYLRPPVQSSWKLFYWAPWACIPRWDVIRNIVTLGWLSFGFVISLIISLYSSFTKKFLISICSLSLHTFNPPIPFVLPGHGCAILDLFLFTDLWL